MAYLEELLPEFRKGAKISKQSWAKVLGEDCYYRLENNTIIYYSGIEERPAKTIFSLEDILSDDWFILKDPEPDWQYIIDHKCLCWFWDDNPNYVMCLGYLTRLMNDCPNNEGFIYCKDNGVAFKNCRPVRRDEVTFYEDRENE